MGKYLDSSGLSDLIGLIKTAIGNVQSALANYLPLSGGTLTGALTGTKATFDEVWIDDDGAVIYGGANGQIYIKSGANSSSQAAHLAMSPADSSLYVRYSTDGGSTFGSWQALANCAISNTWLATQQQYFSGNKNWSERDTVADLTTANNGFSSGTRYHEWLSYDKNNYIPGGVSNTIASGGNVAPQLRSRNYKTGTTTSVDNTLTLTVAKDGTRSVSVSESAPWRSALALNWGLRATWLYNNTTGTTGTVTLSETAANFQVIEIWFHDNDSEWNSVRVVSPNGKKVDLITMKRTSAANLYFKQRRVSISGTSMSNTGTPSMGQGYINNSDTTGTGDLSNAITICHVMGWRA